MKTTPKSILRFTAIAFLVVTPLAMATLTIPRLRNSVLRITGLQNSKSQPSVPKTLSPAPPSGAQTAEAKSAPDNPAVAETAEPVEQKPVISQKKTDSDPRPQGIDLEAPEAREARLRAASVPYSFAGQERDNDRDRSRQNRATKQIDQDEKVRRPREERLVKARDFTGDLRQLPYRRPKIRRERPERELEPNPSFYVPPGGAVPQNTQAPETAPDVSPEPKPPAPPPNIVFEGLDREFWGAGSPPDTVGDVGPTYYIQAVNTSVGIYDKAGNLQTAFTFDTLMSQGVFGNQCDTENFGDPVVLYDTFEDRWILTDFAFTLDGGGNVNPPIAFQCFAVSQTGNPVTGGWYFYSRTVTDFLNDYPKFGIWPDGLYMSANMFGFPAGGAFQHARVWAFNKAQMYAGSPTVKVVSFNVGGGDFTVIPSNARLQTGTPPVGRPNLFLSSWQFLNALTVYKFHVDWTNLSLSTFTGPDAPLAATSWPNAAVANAPQPGTANLLDVLQIRAMMQNQYTNFGGTESLWVPHTVRRANTTGFAAPRWYQVNVTGGTVAAAIPQAATWDPDGANTNHRFMPSLALNRNGDMAMGYSISNSTTRFPSMAYAGRLATDPVNTFGQTETFMFTGTASQTTSTRWGDYSAMTLDPDGCTFWYTNEYANPLDQTAAKRWKTKIGSFTFPGCTTFGAGGTVSGTVTVNPGGAPISGATVNLGSGRITTTDGSGNYSFLNIPAGTYPSIDASKPGYTSASASSIVVTDGNTTTQNFALTDAADSACLTDTTQADFLAGVPTSVDLNTSPGDVTLANTPNSDQANTAGTTTGTGFGTPAWTGQTFIAGLTGQLVQADIQLFCNGCGATPPNLTLSVRNTAAGLPTGADLASTTIPGSAFASGGTVLFTATFSSPTAVTSGTQYALILRPVSAPAGSGYFWIRSSPSTYASGSRVLSADSGGTWSTDTTRDYNFRTYVQTGYSASGNLVSAPKDANPGTGITPFWLTLSWNATTPANTSVKFQLAGSNNVNGPFNFVGPDNTAGTFFTTSPATLPPQFNNFRYLEYKAILETTNSAVTPTLHDVTLCFEDEAPPVVTTTAGSLSYTENDPATAVDPGVTITDNNGTTLVGATVSITTNFQSGEDALSWVDNNLGDSITQGASTAQTIILTGTDTLANYQAAVRAVTYVNSSESPSTATRTVTFTADGGVSVNNVGSGTRNITVISVNDKPVNTVPGAQFTAANTPLTFSSGNGNQISVADLDAGVNTIQVTLTAANGTLTLSGTSGLSFSFSDGNGTGAGDGTADATMTFRGTLADVNAALNGLTFTPTAGFSGSASVTITSNDLGNSGGAAETDTDVVNIQVSSNIVVNDANAVEPVSPNTVDMVFTVTLNVPAPGPVTVNFTTQDEPAGPGKAVSGTCGSGGDYTLTAGSVSFTLGQQVKTINVPICSDNVSEPDETFLVLLSSPSGGTILDGTATGTILSANTAGAVQISELRTSGPGGAGDDFVEIYNNSNSSKDISGYGLFKMAAGDCNGTPVLIGSVPGAPNSSTTVIPARGHYLFVGSAYTLANYGGTGAAAGNLTLSTDIETDANVGLFSTSNLTAISSVNRLDAVGFGVNTGGACNLLREGSTLPPIAGNATIEHSYFRKMCDWLQGAGCLVPGIPKDTNNNSVDFWLADTAASAITGRLGAPGPENLASPIRRDSANNPGIGGINVFLLDGNVSAAAGPNRDRNGSDPAGTFGSMKFRYRVTNNTGAPVTRLRYRIVELSTAIQPAGPTADLRAISGTVEPSIGPVNDAATCTAAGAGSPPCTVTVTATTLETPPNQAIGGGYNSTWSSGTISTGSPLPNGQSILINLKLGVEKTGQFRFYLIVEALP